MLAYKSNAGAAFANIRDIDVHGRKDSGGAVVGYT